MFSNFSTYLFGNSNDYNIPNGKENELITVEETDGDWLLVEKRRKGSSFDVDEEVENLEPCKTSDCNLPANEALTASTTATSAVPRRGISLPSSPTQMACLDGSWYITPPSCFTAGPPSHVQTSPLENLLIEHPSMSVYASVDSNPSSDLLLKKHRRYEQKPTETGTRQPSQDRCEDTSCTSLECHCEPKDDPRLVRTNGHRQRSPTLVGKPGLLEQIQNQADVEKLRQCHQTKFWHRKQLERLNKAQEFKSLGKRHRRKDFMKNPSGKSNNRKF